MGFIALSSRGTSLRVVTPVRWLWSVCGRAVKKPFKRTPRDMESLHDVVKNVNLGKNRIHIQSPARTPLITASENHTCWSSSGIGMSVKAWHILFGSNPSMWKTRTGLFCPFYIMVTDATRQNISSHDIDFVNPECSGFSTWRAKSRFITIEAFHNISHVCCFHGSKYAT